jgi:acetyl-CoA C-acetyltransferase
LAKRSLADRDGLPFLAIKGHATHKEPQVVSRRRQAGHSQTPDKVGWSVGDVDLFEINEALRSGTMAGAEG